MSRRHDEIRRTAAGNGLAAANEPESDSGLEPGSDAAPGGAPDHADVAFHPPFLLLACLAAGFGLRWVLPAGYLPAGLADVAGPVLVAAALALFAWAVVTMRSGGASVPTNLPTACMVVTGPYRWSRNPIYLAMVGLVAGTGIWANSLWFLGLAAVMVVLLNRGVIVREEAYLTRKFGDAYLHYRSSVRRWC